MKKVLILVVYFGIQVFAFDLSSAANMLGNTASSSESVKTQNNPLINALTSSLGVSSSQAVGGTTAILSKAASSMTNADVSSLTASIPSLSSFIGKDSTVGSLLSTASLGSQFSALGMDSNMVIKFIPIILEFINSNAGATLMQSVQTALK